MDARSMAAYLNNLMAAAPETVFELMETRVPWAELPEHDADTEFVLLGEEGLGTLGVLNGMLLKEGSAEIVWGKYDSASGKLLGFEAGPERGLK